MSNNLIQFFQAVGAYAAGEVNVFRLDAMNDVLHFWQCMMLREEWGER